MTSSSNPVRGGRDRTSTRFPQWVRFGLLLASVGFGSAVACKAEQRSVQIVVEQAEIHQRLNETFPIRKMAALSEVTLKNPRVLLRKGADTIGVQLDVELIAPIIGKHRGTLAVVGKLEYREAAKAFFLLDPVVETITIEGLPEAALATAKRPIEAVAAPYLQGHPVYQLTGNNLKDIAAGYALRSVNVENGQLRATLGPP